MVTGVLWMPVTKNSAPANPPPIQGPAARHIPAWGAAPGNPGPAGPFRSAEEPGPERAFSARMGGNAGVKPQAQRPTCPPTHTTNPTPAKNLSSPLNPSRPSNPLSTLAIKSIKTWHSYPTQPRTIKEDPKSNQTQHPAQRTGTQSLSPSAQDPGLRFSPGGREAGLP